MMESAELNAFLRSRFSPKAFDGSVIEAARLTGFFEAAQWAPSSYNEQPWRFYLASRADGPRFAQYLDCLVEANQAWAKDASALMFTVAKRERRRDGMENVCAWYDVGQAISYFTIAALAQGIYLHQMQGFYPQAARDALDLDSGFDPLTAVAIGRPAAGEDVRAQSRERLPLSEIIRGPEAAALRGG